MTDNFFEQNYLQELYDIHEGQGESIIHALEEATDPRLKYPLYIKFNDRAINSLLCNQNELEKTTWKVAQEPNLANRGRSTYNAQFGYLVQGEFQRIGPINYITYDWKGRIAEIGFSNQILLQYFKYQLFGRKVTPEKAAHIMRIHESMFSFLQNDAASQQKLMNFAVGRGWPHGLAESVSLAYLDGRLVDLAYLAKNMGFSNGDISQAGWFEMNFSSSGDVSFSIRDSEVIRIPYFYNQRIVAWRTRHLHAARTALHKYTSWPLDRSVQNWGEFETKLYNSWKLSEVKGKPVIITEGEFKCIVTMYLSGILTVGIPGITEVDDKTLQLLVEAQASEYIIVLDRDPFGKGAMRVDGITDSQRAAYLIAIRLERAGAKNVRIGIIPESKSGKKVGLDDLILETGIQALWDILQYASHATEYARRINLDQRLCEIYLTRQKLKKAIENYTYSNGRGGPRLDPVVSEHAKYIQEQIESLYKRFLNEQFRGATRISQPMRHFQALFHHEIPDPENKLVMIGKKEQLPLLCFTEDTLMLQFYLEDTPDNTVWVLNPNLRLKFSQAEISGFLRTGRTENQFLEEKTMIGQEILRRDNSMEAVPSSIYTLGTEVMAGYLANWFPEDEYTFKRNITLCINYAEYIEELVTIPLVVFSKKSNRAVACATCVVWEDNQEVKLANDISSRVSDLIIRFFRSGNAIHASDKYRMVTDTLWPYWFDRNLRFTQEVMEVFGITHKTVIAQKLLLIRSEDIEEVINHFAFRRLLNQATLVGIVQRNPTGKIEPRFKGNIVLMPVLTTSGMICALRVFPLELFDHKPPAVPLVEKLVYHLYGPGRQLVYELDPERYLYLNQQLNRVKSDGSLLITFQELDSLALFPAEVPIVSLNSTCKVKQEVIDQIAARQPKNIYMVLSSVPSSEYDAFAFDAIPGYIKDLLEFQERLNEALQVGQPPIKVFVMLVDSPLTSLTREISPQVCVEQIMTKAIELSSYLHALKFNNATHMLVKQFVKVNNRLMDYLEILALPDFLDEKSIDWYVKESYRVYEALQKQVESQYRITVPRLEAYMQYKLGLEVATSLEELVFFRREHQSAFMRKSIYRTTEDQGEIRELSASFCGLYERVTMGWTETNRSIKNVLQRPSSLEPNTPKTSKNTSPEPKRTTIREQIKAKLKMKSGEDNYIGRLYEVIAIARLEDPKFFTTQIVDEMNNSLFSTIVSVKLPDNTILQSDAKSDKKKKQSQQNAARDLLEKIVQYYG